MGSSGEGRIDRACWWHDHERCHDANCGCPCHQPNHKPAQGLELGAAWMRQFERWLSTGDPLPSLAEWKAAHGMSEKGGGDGQQR